MKFLLHLFDYSYNHPSALPGDPARHISGQIRVSIFFGNVFFWFGLFFFIPGACLFFYFLPLTDIYSFRMGNDLTEVEGRIIEIRETDHYECIYEYEVNGKKYNGSAFKLVNDTTIHINDHVNIQYQNNSPSTSKIKGMKMAPASFLDLLFTFIFLSFGLAIMIAFLHVGMRTIMMLRHGIVTEALITDNIFIKSDDDEKPDTNDIHVEFISNKGETIRTIINIETGKKARSGKNATILYLPWDNSNATFLGSLNPEYKQIVLGGNNKRVR